MRQLNIASVLYVKEMKNKGKQIQELKEGNFNTNYNRHQRNNVGNTLHDFLIYLTTL